MIIKQQQWAGRPVGLRIIQPISALYFLYCFSIGYYYYWMRFNLFQLQLES